MAELSKRVLESELKRVKQIYMYQTIAEQEKHFFETYINSLQQQIDARASKTQLRKEK